MSSESPGDLRRNPDQPDLIQMIITNVPSDESHSLSTKKMKILTMLSTSLTAMLMTS